MSTLPEPVFFDTDAATILADCTAYYEGLVGKKLSPAQTETLLINAFAYREKMLRIAGNSAARQMLLAYAVYPALDYLGELLGVTRLPANQALCTLQFSLVTGHGALVIPAGVRVQSKDGKVVFTTLVDVSALNTDATVSVDAECTVEGVIGNGYQVGDIAIILDPQAYVTSATNTDVTNAGTDQESDTSLRERIRLAPSSFSTAGPTEAYIFFAKSANPSIIDVSILSPVPGSIVIYPLMAGGVAPSTGIIDAVLAKCNPETVRPQNDIVSVVAPTAVDYSIVVNLTLLKDAIQQTVVAQVSANLAAYKQYRQTKLGVDVIINQVIGQSMVPGVYEAAVPTPSADVLIGLDEFANCTGITVNVIGVSDE